MTIKTLLFSNNFALTLLVALCFTFVTWGPTIGFILAASIVIILWTLALLWTAFGVEQNKRIALEVKLTTETAAHKITKAVSRVRDGEISELQGTIATKDALVEALQKRCENLNREYHNKVYKRQVIMLDDVHKLTGEDRND
jgi:filamentous hemagglutinin family protein